MISHDTLELLNGPEDGSEFSIMETSVGIGSGANCAVRIRFDEKIRPCHARLSAVAAGYRVRASEGGRVLVNGKKAGRIRSRHVCHGDVLRVGESEFHLHCAAEGIAARSHGTVLESDIAWILRGAARNGLVLVRGLWRGVRRLLGPLFWPLAAAAVLLLLIRWYVPRHSPGIWYHVQYWTGWLRFTIGNWLS